MDSEGRRVRLKVGLVVAGGLALALLFGLTRLAFGGLSSAAARPLAGSLDPSFGSGGVVTHRSSSNESGIRGMAVQPDGKIVAVASGSLVRYLPDGSLDPSFGAGGYVATAISADAIALQPDGKIVVAGDSGPVSESIDSEFAVARYRPDGSLDTSFGTNGIAKTIIRETTQCGGTSGADASALAVLPGGGILAAGSTEILDCYFPGNSGWALVRYTSDGSTDPTFGDAGIVQTSFFGQDVLGGVAVQRDGKIVATGSAGGFGHGGIDTATMALARYEPDGSLDPRFGTAGKVTTNPKRFRNGGPSAFQHRKILVAGSTSENGNTPWFPVLARYARNGVLDSTFGTHGYVEIRRQLGAPSAMLAQKDGKILIAESSSPGPSTVVRLLPDGRLDPSFGRGGLVAVGGEVSTLALQTDRKVLVGGASSNAWMLARLIGGNNCIVPGLRGKTVSRASAALERSHCRRGRITRRFSNTVARGRVISAAARRGARLSGGAKVDLAVSRGRSAPS
jgi:uncharacterized delta-60 repeat protein